MRDSRPLHPPLALGARAILAAALAAASLAVASPAAAAPVINTTTDQALGNCSVTCSLRDAVALSSSGSTLTVPAGHYVLTLGAIHIPFGMTLAGAGARTTVIDANGGPGIFTLTVAILSNTTLSDLSLVNSVGQSAIVASGTNGGLTLTHLTIANNRNAAPGSKGGGVYSHDMGGFAISGCTFSNNVAESGGGLYAENISGGSILDSTFFGNDAAQGGSAIQANTVSQGISLFGDTLTANTSAPALVVSHASHGVVVNNTLVAGNPGGGCSFAASTLQSFHSLDGNGSCGFTDPGSLTGVDPHLGPLADNGGPTDTAALLAGSPAKDAGFDSTCLDTDQRGVSRPQGAHCDIGAYEVIVPAPNCDGAVASPNLLWPANGKMVPIHINGVTNPSGGMVTFTVLGIFQDEPVAGSPDATGVNTATPAVRARRDGGGDGRVYHIFFTATNAGGGSCFSEVTVGVPHDQGKHSTPVDGGRLYDSTMP